METKEPYADFLQNDTVLNGKLIIYKKGIIFVD